MLDGSGKGEDVIWVWEGGRTTGTEREREVERCELFKQETEEDEKYKTGDDNEAGTAGIKDEVSGLGGDHTNLLTPQSEMYLLV